MGSLRRILGTLFGSGTPKPEDIVFEPIGGPAAAEALRPVRVSGHRVALGELMPRVPVVWKRSAEWSPEQILELPAEARLNAGAERPLAFSLRYLVSRHPGLFRDPGPQEPDSGVDLLMEPLKEPEAQLKELPAELVGEVHDERDTFAQWEDDKLSARQSSKEALETEKALRSVRLPTSPAGQMEGFDKFLHQSSGEPAPAPPSRPQTPVVLPEVPPTNLRLKRILEAYAEGIPAEERPQVVPAVASVLRVLGNEQVEISPKARALSEELTTTLLHAAPQTLSPRPAPQAFAVSKPEASSSSAELAGPPELHQMRFEELGLSLSRFSEVRGFALWLGEHAMQTGDLGFDTRAAAARFRMEKILESALLTQGAQDGFVSVTVHNARGGVSVFGGGPCLVAVSHQGEGMPSQLRAWLCGWVSQPLRG